MTLETFPDEQETCPRCGKRFHCSKSGKCWCYEVAVDPEKMDEIEALYNTCLCPVCLTEYASFKDSDE